MRLLKTLAGLRASLESREPGQSLGLVPTMGALHPGHLSLMKRAIAENDLVVVTIFVNPLQFGPTEDLNHYPQQLEQDCQLCRDMGVNLVFAPTPAEMGLTEEPGATSVQTLVIPPPAMTSVLCGPFRPGHFQGVVTIITKIFSLIRPERAYFGEKDAQQLAIIQKLVQDLNLGVEIKPCPIIREPSGLAYSSRNQYLSPQERQEASKLYLSLQKAQAAFWHGEQQTSVLIEIVKKELSLSPAFQIEYVEIVEPGSLKPLETIEKRGLLAIAAYLGKTRLIDNLMLKNRSPLIAIDGPAGAGKSTVTRRLAQALGLLYLDTGAMYRAVTWWVRQCQIPVTDEIAIAELISDLDLEIIPAPNLQTPTQVFINQKDVTQEIRSLEVTAQVSTIAAQKAVRTKLIATQRQWGAKGGLVAEGRDIGTNVFPDADLKIFLTASVAARAKRRLQDLEQQGITNVSLTELEKDIQFRDEQDSKRSVSPLQKAPDAIVIDTDHLTIEAVTNQIIALYQQKVRAQSELLQFSGPL